MDNFNGRKRSGLDAFYDSATEQASNPGDFELGSLESRATARALVESGTLRIQVLFCEPDGSQTKGPLITAER